MIADNEPCALCGHDYGRHFNATTEPPYAGCNHMLYRGRRMPSRCACPGFVERPR